MNFEIIADIGATTAGQTINISRGQDSVQVSLHYAIDFERVCSILLHEMCHVAQFEIDHDLIMLSVITHTTTIGKLGIINVGQCFQIHISLTAFHNWN